MGLKISEDSDLVELLSLIFTQITTSPTLEAQLHAHVEDRIIEIGLVTRARERPRRHISKAHLEN